MSRGFFLFLQMPNSTHRSAESKKQQQKNNNFSSSHIVTITYTCTSISLERNEGDNMIDEQERGRKGNSNSNSDNSNHESTLYVAQAELCFWPACLEAGGAAQASRTTFIHPLDFTSTPLYPALSFCQTLRQ